MHSTLNTYFRAAGLTNPGQLREKNEDNFVIDARAGLLLVADGMGGHQSGEQASADAIKVMQACLVNGVLPEDGESDSTLAYSKNGSAISGTDLPIRRRAHRAAGYLGGTRQPDDSNSRRVARAIAAANERINRRNFEHGYGPREAMGTTIVGLYTQTDRPMDATVFHVGDSRLYLYRDGSLGRVTRDHSAYENWLRDGGNGPAPGQHILSQAIGPSDVVVPAIQQHSFRPGDVVLLCTDGLTNLVSDDHIGTLLDRLDRRDLVAGCQSLIDAAQSNGGTDNITVVLGAYSNGQT